nr:uncharacterized protein LOC126055275 isoform X2 [Helicoverpa armigera]
MGRKIPAKKHRGVKDPLVQQAKRLESLKGKINAPPKDPDEQPVPRSLTRLFAFQDQDKRRRKVKKGSHSPLTQNKDGSISNIARNPLSGLHKLPGESGRAFSLRINSAVKALHNPDEELHYPADMEAGDEKGERMAELRERRARKRRRAAGPAGAPAAAADPPALSRTQRLALKKKARKLKASEARSERHEVVYERVAFGDVTHAPPSLRAAARASERAARGGVRARGVRRRDARAAQEYPSSL